MNATRALVISLFCAALMAGCGKAEQTSLSDGVAATPKESDKILNLYIWSDLLAPDTIANFEKETGIKVSESNYGSNEELDAKLAPGDSGYDIVVPSGSIYERQIRSGYFRKLDKSLLTNLPNMDPQMLQAMAIHDPDNEYAVLHSWATMGIGYNVEMLKASAPDARLDSLMLIFDPVVARKLQKCGIAMLDSASDVFSMALIAIGKDSNSQNAADLEAAADALMKIRPYIRQIDTVSMIASLANGEVCVALGYNGDMVQARDRARENRTGQEIAYINPKEGSVDSFNGILIPKDAPHPENAHAFINYLLRPQVIAAVTNSVKYANGNAAAAPFVDNAIFEDPAVYPPPEVRAGLVPERPDTAEATRLMTRLWTRFVTGR